MRKRVAGVLVAAFAAAVLASPVFAHGGKAGSTIVAGRI
jgi:hypothetical protein